MGADLERLLSLPVTASGVNRLLHRAGDHTPPIFSAGNRDRRTDKAGTVFKQVQPHSPHFSAFRSLEAEAVIRHRQNGYAVPHNAFDPDVAGLAVF